ncbi:MAG: Ribose transport system permease protein RbsC [Firmicutes bacterium ADurb.Bin182]|nr:MAG: Ribose transport system permease protein RbsC [Firmicutes bacterium ADurb.Bin182]
MSEQKTFENSRKFLGKVINAPDKQALRTMMPLVGLIAIIVIFAFLTDMKIVQTKSINLILSQVYVLMIACSGVFMVMTVGGLDFSQGSLLGLSSIVISYLSFHSMPLAIVAGIVTGALIGAFNGLIHVAFKIPSFIVTICSMFLFRGICAYLTTDAPVAAKTTITVFNETWINLSLTFAVLLIVFLVFRFTKLGISLKAIGAGETAARFSGIRTKRIKFLVFAAAGAITGFAAFLNVAKVGSITATSGSQLETQILIALVLGGLPIMGGAKVHYSSVIVGTLMFCILQNGLVMVGLDSAEQQLVKGIIFVLVVALTIDRRSLRVIK